MIVLLSSMMTLSFLTASYFEYRQHRMDKRALRLMEDVSGKINNQCEQNIDGGNIQFKIQDRLSSNTLILKIGGYSLPVDLSKPNGTVLYPISLQTESSTHIKKVASDKDMEVILDESLIDGETDFKFNLLSKDVRIPLRISLDGDHRFYYIQTLPESFPKYSMVGEKGLRRPVLADYINGDNSYVYKITDDGLSFYYSLPARFTHSSGGVMNLESHKVDGDIYYSFFRPTIAHDAVQVGLVDGVIEVLNDRFEPLRTIELKNTSKNPFHKRVENHDFILLSKDHYLVTATIDTPVILSDGKRSLVKAAYVQEVKDNQVVFEWKSTDDDKFLKDSVEGNDWDNTNQRQDYVHINSIDIDPEDGNIIMSFRHQDSVVKVDRSNGQVLWTLGGKGDNFQLSEEQRFSRQHYAHYLRDGSILIFDNGNDKHQSRGIRFWIDEKKRKVKAFKALEIKGFFSPACGSVELLDDQSQTYLFGWGCASRETDNLSWTTINFSTGEFENGWLQESDAQSYRANIMAE